MVIGEEIAFLHCQGDVLDPRPLVDRDYFDALLQLTLDQPKNDLALRCEAKDVAALAHALRTKRGGE